MKLTTVLCAAASALEQTGDDQAGGASWEEGDVAQIGEREHGAVHELLERNLSLDHLRNLQVKERRDGLCRLRRLDEVLVAPAGQGAWGCSEGGCAGWC